MFYLRENRVDESDTIILCVAHLWRWLQHMILEKQEDMFEEDSTKFLFAVAACILILTMQTILAFLFH